ncbi:MAG: HAD-IB family phosphatase [Candidatus Gracilibacteria bacterium]|jgi:D-3-phosphoglycerate dehydrogenase|nr:HAD-IB family phosphatase [Candidatus Gracilibacteria bacterium]
MEHLHVVFDFDSTLIGLESLEVLAEFLLKEVSRSERQEIISEIERITDLGMNGDLSLDESIFMRMSVLPPINEKAIGKAVDVCINNITPSIERVLRDLESVYVVSGGPSVIVNPVANYLGIPTQNIRSSVFEFDERGLYDRVRSFVLDDKSIAINEMIKDAQDKHVVMVGDGVADLATLGNPCRYFVGFVEHKEREVIMSFAEHVAGSAGELHGILRDFKAQ